MTGRLLIQLRCVYEYIWIERYIDITVCTYDVQQALKQLREIDKARVKMDATGGPPIQAQHRAAATTSWSSYARVTEVTQPAASVKSPSGGCFGVDFSLFAVTNTPEQFCYTLSSDSVQHSSHNDIANGTLHCHSRAQVGPSTPLSFKRFTLKSLYLVNCHNMLHLLYADLS